jgi:hypothetical protein
MSLGRHQKLAGRYTTRATSLKRIVLGRPNRTITILSSLTMAAGAALTSMKRLPARKKMTTFHTWPGR